MKVTIFILIILCFLGYYSFFNKRIDKQNQCLSSGELYYSNFLKDFEKSEQKKLGVFINDHLVGYSRKLKTCLIYIDTRITDLKSVYGNRKWDKYIKDIYGNKIIYSMQYSADGTVLDPGGFSDFLTEEEFIFQKNKLFNY